MHGLKVDTPGFVQSIFMPYVGYSPDGLVGLNRSLEIKCGDPDTHALYILERTFLTEYKEQLMIPFVV